MTELRPARDEDEVRAALALRHEVFVVEQRVPVEEEVDRHDATALHLVAVEDGRVVATCRLLGEGEARARAQGASRIALAAQTGALALYEQAGYTPYGERFVDAGIEHVMMEKRLA